MCYCDKNTSLPPKMAQGENVNRKRQSFAVKITADETQKIEQSNADFVPLMARAESVTDRAD